MSGNNTDTSSCLAAAEALLTISNQNQVIQASNNDKNAKYAALVQQWNDQYQTELQNWKNTYANYGIQNYGTADQASYNKYKDNDDQKVWSLGRIAGPAGNSQSYHDGICKARLGNGFDADIGVSKPALYGATDGTGRGAVDLCLFSCWGYKYLCKKTQAQLDLETRQKNDALLLINNKYQGTLPSRPPELTLQDYQPLPTLVCQDCQSKFNVSSSNNITVDSSQVSKCINYLQNQTATSIPPSSATPVAPITPSPSSTAPNPITPVSIPISSSTPAVAPITNSSPTTIPNTSNPTQQTQQTQQIQQLINIISSSNTNIAIAISVAIAILFFIFFILF